MTQPEPRLQTRSPSAWLKLYLKGVVMGSADVVPGVSGGTMALILGIYEELILSLQHFSKPPFWRALRNFRLGAAFRAVNGSFLLVLLFGILTALLLLARLLHWLLEHQQLLVYSFFFGLILASCWLVGKRVTGWTSSRILALLGSALGAWWLVGLSPATTPETAWFVLLSGALAICAMILPGISGAFILVLLGKYAFMLEALSQGRLGVILLFVFGAAAGLLSFVRLLGWLFEHYPNLTLALLTGFMLGSLHKVWPWQSPTGALARPDFAAGALGASAAALTLMGLGALLVLGLERVGARRTS